MHVLEPDVFCSIPPPDDFDAATCVAGPHRPYQTALVVDDEPVLRRVIARNLAARGLVVQEASTVCEGLQAIASRRPDVLLLDVNLPDRSGWDLLRDLQSQGCTVPTIVVSAVRVSAARLEELHPLAYLPKPFPMDALLRLVAGERPPVEAQAAPPPLEAGARQASHARA